MKEDKQKMTVETDMRCELCREKQTQLHVGNFHWGGLLEMKLRRDGRLHENEVVTWLCVECRDKVQDMVHSMAKEFKR